MRIRSSAKFALFYALVICAMQNNVSWALESISFYSPVNVIHLYITNLEEQPAHCLSPISSDLLPQSAQPVVSGALWFSNFAFKSSSAVESYDPAVSKLTNNNSASYVIAYISGNTLDETIENPFSWSV